MYYLSRDCPHQSVLMPPKNSQKEETNSSLSGCLPQKYLHSLNIAHGNLKLSNILISISKNDPNPKMKPADSGLSHAFRNQDDSGYEDNHFRPPFSKGWMSPFDSVGEDGKRRWKFVYFLRPSL